MKVPRVISEWWVLGLMIAFSIAAVIWLGITVSSSKEPFRSCTDCDKTGAADRIPTGGMTVLNPFVYPYSGTSCVNDLYVLHNDADVDLGSDLGPLTHLNTPDHVAMTR